MKDLFHCPPGNQKISRDREDEVKTLLIPHLQVEVQKKLKNL